MRINEQEITFTKKRGVKHLRIRIKSDGTCTVTVPFRVPMLFARRFVEEKREWIIEKQREMEKRREEGEALPPVRSFREVRAEALRFTTQKVEEWNRHYGFSYTKVSVRNQKTRWGSCSRRGSLSFNYRIVFLPPHLVDYLIVHELCHLKEFNHSKKFWTRVAEVCPNYCELREELKKYM